MPQHFLSIAAEPADRLIHLLDLASELKAEHASTGHNAPLLAGKTLAMIFEKPSLRTRVSFAAAAAHLGATPIVLTGDEVGLGKRELPRDVARVLGGMCDGVMARVFEHEKLLEMAEYSTIPVINGLSDFSHPCQSMADVLTIREHFGSLDGLHVAYIGDGNNVARSLAEACGKLGMKFTLAAPVGFELPPDEVELMQREIPGLSFTATTDPMAAAKTADVLYTDTWVSMGQEREKADRISHFEYFQINEAMLAAAPKRAIVLHCLPAYRGLEITDGVMESPQSKVFEQAHNRLHAQKAILADLMSKKI